MIVPIALWTDRAPAGAKEHDRWVATVLVPKQPLPLVMTTYDVYKVVTVS